MEVDFGGRYSMDSAFRLSKNLKDLHGLLFRRFRQLGGRHDVFNVTYRTMNVFVCGLYDFHVCAGDPLPAVFGDLKLPARKIEAMQITLKRG